MVTDVFMVVLLHLLAPSPSHHKLFHHAGRYRQISFAAYPRVDEKRWMVRSRLYQQVRFSEKKGISMYQRTIWSKGFSMYQRTTWSRTASRAQLDAICLSVHSRHSRLVFVIAKPAKSSSSALRSLRRSERCVRRPGRTSGS